MFSNKLLSVMFRNVGSNQHTNILLFTKSIQLMNNLSSSMKKLIDEHKYQEALDLFHRNSTSASNYTITLALKACTKLKNLNYAIQIHKNLSSKSINDMYIHTSLIHLYMTCNNVDKAYGVFNKIGNKSCGAYNAVFKGLISKHQYEKVFELYDQMSIKADSVTLNLLFTACAKLPNEHAAKIKYQYLNQIPKLFTYDNYVLNPFLHMLMNFGDVSQAEIIFNQMKKKDIFTYGTMMQGLNKNNQYEKVFELYDQMSIEPDAVILNLLFTACAKLPNEHAAKIKNQYLNQIPKLFTYDNHVLNSFSHMLMNFGDVLQAELVFAQMKKKDIVTYGTMMQGLIKNEQYEKVFELYDQMSIEPDAVILNLLFTACAKLPNKHAAKIKNQYLNQIPKLFTYGNRVLNSCLHMLMNFGDVSQAELIFIQMKTKDIITYKMMMQGLINKEQYEKVFELYDQMSIEPDAVILNLLFTACAKLPNEHAAKIKNQYLNQIPKLFTYDNHVLNSCLHMLMNFGDVSQAELVFAQMKKKDIVTYGTMMQGLIKNEQYEKVFELYDQMSIEPDAVILNLLFTACGKLPNEHAAKIKNKYLSQISKLCSYDNHVLNSVLYMLMNFGDVSQAETIFAQMKKKDIVTYGTMMQGFLHNKIFEKTLDLFEQTPFYPNEVMLTILFYTCSQLANERASRLAMKYFKTIPTKLYSNPKLLTSTLQMLFTFGDIINAEKLFTQITTKNIMHYGTMMNGYNINNQPDKCLQLFKQIQQQQQNHIVLDETIYVSALGACSRLGLFTTSQSIVDQIPSSLLTNDRIKCTLIHTWGKVGYINKALEIFQQIQKPDIAIYTAMINSFGLNGRGNEAIQLYQQIPVDLQNEITHICVLNACSHSGLLNQAYSIYNDIAVKTDRIVTTMVDCLSRLCMFKEAEELINQYESSHAPCIPMYMALLSGTRNHRQHHLTQKIYDKMQSLFPNCKEDLKSASVLLENTYKAVGEYEEADKVRLNQIKHFGKRTVVGMSWTDPNGQLFKFKAHDRSHPDSDKIYEELKRISAELLQYGHQYDSSWITRPLADDETIETVLCGHSEKLALAFNYIQQPIPNVIQITKNLRICGDCHSALKLIAKIRERPIIVRDANRLHHFGINGQCSCQDHF